MHTDILFRIDSSSSLPINVQIKEQIKWLIGNDVLKPGDPLPSTNQLGDQLAINRNTIQWVYSQLKEEGLLVIQKGKGTQVADEDKIREFKKLNPYFSFVQNMIKEVYEKGYDAENVLLSAFACTQLLGQPSAKKMRYLFIECKTKSCFFYLEEIKQVSTAEIHTIDISSPENLLRQAMRNSDVIVTIAEMADAVKRFSEPVNTIITVGSTDDVSLLLNMMRPR